MFGVLKDFRHSTILKTYRDILKLFIFKNIDISFLKCSCHVFLYLFLLNEINSFHRCLYFVFGGNFYLFLYYVI